MPLTDKFTAIADAIRSKTGKAAKLTLSEMVAEINSLGSSANAYIAIKELSTHQSANVVLCELPDSVYAHKDDDTFSVAIINLTPELLQNYDEYLLITSNNPESPKQSSYPVHGVGVRKNSSTGVGSYHIYYPPNSSDNTTSIGGLGKVWLNGKNLTYKSAGYFLGAGTLKIIVSWGDQPSGSPPQIDQSKITYNLTPSNADQFITAARAAYADSSGTIVDQYLESGALPVAKSEALSGSVQLTYFDGKTVTENATGSYIIKNVSPNGARLSVVGSNDDTTVSRIVKPTGTVRFIDSLARNARDLGGWPCDGGTVKYGLLYRTAFLSGSDAAYNNKSVYIDRLGVMHEFDLRGSESVESSYFPVGHYHSYSGGIQYDLVVTGTGGYDSLIKELLTDVMNAAIHNEPALFHCSMGCDRTGTLAFYLECILGMSDVDIDIEYELSSLFDDGNSEQSYYYRTRTDQVSGSRWTYLKNKFNSYPGSTISARVIEYLFSIGISAGLMNSFRVAMCDGTPSTLVAPTVNVTGSYTNCSSSDASHSTEKYQPYTATITPDSGYTLEGAAVSVIMGGTDITATAYNNGEINIPSVTGALSISVAAQSSAPVNLFDKDDPDVVLRARFNSSMQPVEFADEQLVTGFIPASIGTTFEFETDKANNTNGYTGFLMLYDANKQPIGGLSNGTTPFVWSSDYKHGSITVPQTYIKTDFTGTSYARFCLAYVDINNIVITET